MLRTDGVNNNRMAFYFPVYVDVIPEVDVIPVASVLVLVLMSVLELDVFVLFLPSSQPQVSQLPFSAHLSAYSHSVR